jgi:DNA-repair protein complementing XP-A cells
VRRLVSLPHPARLAISCHLLTLRQEESRLRAKDLRTQRDAIERATGTAGAVPRTSTGLVETADITLAGSKRPFSAMSTAKSTTPTSNRDARVPDDALPAAKKFTKYVDYNFSAMSDTKGGFLSLEDDPWNKSMSATGGANDKPGSAGPQEQKPEAMTLAEWERLQLIRKLQRTKAGPYEPGLSVLADKTERKTCRECGSLEIDYRWEEVFGCAVCGACKDKYPEKYSLLTKTEAREDYLLTDRTWSW